MLKYSVQNKIFVQYVLYLCWLIVFSFFYQKKKNELIFYKCTQITLVYLYNIIFISVVRSYLHLPLCHYHCPNIITVHFLCFGYTHFIRFTDFIMHKNVETNNKLLMSVINTKFYERNFLEDDRCPPLNNK